MMRWQFGRWGREQFGKFTAPCVLPSLMNLMILLVTSDPIFSCASSVLPPMCGERMTFGKPIRGLSFVNGSVGYTSKYAPAKCPDLIAAATCSKTTHFPRAAFSTYDPLFIKARRFLFI